MGFRVLIQLQLLTPACEQTGGRMSRPAEPAAHAAEQCTRQGAAGAEHAPVPWLQRWQGGGPWRERPRRKAPLPAFATRPGPEQRLSALLAEAVAAAQAVARPPASRVQAAGRSAPQCAAQSGGAEVGGGSSPLVPWTRHRRRACRRLGPAPACYLQVPSCSAAPRVGALRVPTSCVLAWTLVPRLLRLANMAQRAAACSSPLHACRGAYQAARG